MRILLIVPPERFDFYQYLAEAENIEWMLLWHEKKSQMKLESSLLPIIFSSVSFWEDFITPQQLIKKLNPNKIVFFEIIDLRQIALMVFALSQKIPTFYLEHGAAADKKTAIKRWKEINFFQHKLPYLINRFKFSFFDIISSKIFYYSVTKGFYSFTSYIKFLLLPFKMLWGSPNKVLSSNIFRERVPMKSIVFNEVNFKAYSLYTGIKTEEAIFTGVPAFDNYSSSNKNLKNHIVFIDHPYLEDNLCKWNAEHHLSVANAIFEFAEQMQTRVYIKLHPRSNILIWQNYNYNNDFITIIQDGNYIDLFLEARLILGFSSSLINGFLCAKKNVVLLGWHPEPGIFGTDFSKTGLCHKSLNIEELLEKYEYWVSHNLTEENEVNYLNFLKEYNYPFDGRATERVIKAITENGNS